jgi:type IV secretory pathway VirB4 component
MPKKTNPATQDFVPIRDIRENVVIKKNGEMVMILLASSVNFALKSYDEQRAILQQFQNFLNTLDFSLQIHVQSRKLNIEPYMTILDQLRPKQVNELMKIQLSEYIEFIRTFTTEVDVMSKSFFIVIPYSPTKLNVTNTVSRFFGGTRSSQTIQTSDQQFEEHRLQLEQRVAMVVQGLGGVGVRTMTLGKDELVEFFYHLYNPGDPTGNAPAVQS